MIDVDDMEYERPLQICLEGRDEVVRIPTEPIDLEIIATDAMQSYFDDMIEAMLRYAGIGIAANQVGQSLQIFVIHKDFTPSGDHLVVINPRMVSQSSRTQSMEEGCLSVPGVFGPVERAAKVRVKGYGRDGRPLDLKAKGMLARILQHEYDHLQATVFIDRAASLQQKTTSLERDEL